MANQDEDINQYTQDAKVNMKNKALGLDAGSTNFFAESNQGNDSSNDARYLQNNTLDARRRVPNTALGLAANTPSFFAETNQESDSSNSPRHLKKMFDDARNNMG